MNNETLLAEPVLTPLRADRGWRAREAPRPDASDPTRMITISAARTTLGILPGLGARAVIWTHNGSPDLLDPTPANSVNHPIGWPDPTPLLDCDPGRGHIVWVGPQSTWWTDQDLYSDLRDCRSVWPPDPILTAAPHCLVEHDEARLVFESPASPYTGTTLRKTFEILPDRRVRCHARLTNTRNHPVARNLWFNFRAPATGREFVPIRAASQVRLADGGISRCAGGFHSVELRPGETRAKAFLNPSAGLIASEVGGGLIIIRFDVTPPDRVPPGHAPVEIFRGRTPGEPDLLELEHHGPLVVIAPGQSIDRSETWEYHPDTRIDDLADGLPLLA